MVPRDVSTFFGKSGKALRTKRKVLVEENIHNLQHIDKLREGLLSSVGGKVIMLTHLRVVCDRECCHDNEDDGLQTIQHLPGFLSHLGSNHTLIKSDSPSESRFFGKRLVSYSYFACLRCMAFSGCWHLPPPFLALWARRIQENQISTPPHLHSEILALGYEFLTWFFLDIL